MRLIKSGERLALECLEQGNILLVQIYFPIKLVRLLKGGERRALECLEQGMRLETEALADLPHLLNRNALDYVDLYV